MCMHVADTDQSINQFSIDSIKEGKKWANTDESAETVDRRTQNLTVGPCLTNFLSNKYTANSYNDDDSPVSFSLIFIVPQEHSFHNQQQSNTTCTV